MKVRSGFPVRARSALLSALFVASAFFVSPADSCFAITIDNFTGDQSTSANSGLPISTSALATSNTLGGYRYIQAEYTGGPLSIEVETTGGFYTHSQQAGVFGKSAILWDGSSSLAKNPLAPAMSLGNLDLTDDGATAFRLRVLQSDLSSTVTVLVYESATNYSKFQVSIPATALDVDLTDDDAAHTFEFPFASFVIGDGATAVADFTNVNAIALLIDGTTSSALDLALNSFETNGLCTHIPVGGLVVDQCGVCNGDNSTCKDCLGVPNGPAKPATACDTGNLGECQTGVFDGACACKQDKLPSTETCDTVDNDCDGQVDELFDTCGVQCGDGSTCIPGCDGVPNSGKVEDKCGVCDGDGTSCTSGCTESDNSDNSFSLDALAKKQEKVIKRGIRLIKQNKISDDLALTLEKKSKTAHSLQIENWILSWTLPQTVKNCPNTIVCVKESSEPIINDYRINAKSLLDINTYVSNQLKKLRQKGRAKDIQRAGQAVYDEAMALADSTPVINAVCTPLNP